MRRANSPQQQALASLALLSGIPLGIPVADNSDWRLQGQERYLKGVVLQRAAYSPSRPDWDHDHCEFCGGKFGGGDSVDALTEGFTTADRYRWICERCFHDFRERFGWSLIEADS